MTHQVTAYQRRCLATGDVIEVVPLELPPQQLDTIACWFTISHELLMAAGIPAARVQGTVHAIEHGFIGMLPRAAICDRWDVGGVSMAVHPHTGLPTIFVYDGYDGGTGIADLAFAVAAETLDAVAELVATCPCDEGCPSCVQSPKCGNWNEYLDKAAALALLRLALDPPTSILTPERVPTPVLAPVPAPAAGGEPTIAALAAASAQRSGRGMQPVSTTARATASTPRRRTRTVA